MSTKTKTYKVVVRDPDGSVRLVFSTRAQDPALLNAKYEQACFHEVLHGRDADNVRIAVA